MKIVLGKKFSELHLDKFINDIYNNFKNLPKDKYYFDLTEVEYISNEELLVFTAVLKLFVESNIDFEVNFFKKNVSSTEINDRVKKQIIQIWQVWKIWTVISDEDFAKYFDIDGNSVDRLQKSINYYPKISEIYTRYGVTPFVYLDYVSNYNELEVQKRIKPVYYINEVITQLLKENGCYHPFSSNSLSTIITEELYLNFLDHSLRSAFGGRKELAFMSISFQVKLDERVYSYDQIQKIKSYNYRTESIKETKNFFYDSKKEVYKNESYVHFSFLDFGEGIANTLKKQYIEEKLIKGDSIHDSDVLRFAFNHNSSRHPIYGNSKSGERLIPRGLFDVLSIVKRYKGLLVIKSNYGKILFDFSKSDNIEKAFSTFGNKTEYFPGSLISVYIPAIENINKISESSIKPEILMPKNIYKVKNYVNFYNIVNDIEKDKSVIYIKLINELKKQIYGSNKGNLTFLSFRGCELVEKRLIKKAMYFLLTDYEINYSNNVIIIHPPRVDIINEVSNEIVSLNEAIKNYKIHPLPLVDYNEQYNDIIVEWLGVYNESDKKVLDKLLFEDYSIAKTDFKDPQNVIGQINSFDSFGNLMSIFPSRKSLINFLKAEDDSMISNDVDELIVKYNCIKKDEGKSLFLSSGNLYQKEYIELNNLLNNASDCKYITSALYTKIKSKVLSSDDSFPIKYKFIGITTTGVKLLKSLVKQKLINESDCILLDNYYTFENELSSELINEDEKYILLCDVISTGNMTKRLDVKLKNLGADLTYIAVITSILFRESDNVKLFLSEYSDKLIYLHEYQIRKYDKAEIREEILDKAVIRINPHTNIPITMSIKDTNYFDSVIFSSTVKYINETNVITITNKYLDDIKSEAINIGFQNFNNSIHPYFFNTNMILSELSKKTLEYIIEKIDKPQLSTDKVKVFYPRKSGIESFNFDLLRDILLNDSVEEMELERFGTIEGWRFPHNTDYLNAKVENNVCLILDDGSCSGNSLIQMIDEISFYKVKEIILLCFVGRVDDHKREFFSRLSSIKVKHGKSISISIYFASHWHIPTYYVDENPNIKETVWLGDISSLQNTPQSIKKIAKNILQEITPKNSRGFVDYKYLPKVKGKNREVPKKDLLLVREELGKVIGYRLYRESFVFFDCFVRKYERLVPTKDRYKEIELLCATLIFEPYLYDKIVALLPDIVEKLENFIRVLIFSNQKIYEHLTYYWNKKNIIHLFFIVFKNEKLLAELDEKKFSSLMNFTEPEESAVSYILYKILSYFPLKESQIKEKKLANQFKGLIDSMIKDGDRTNKELIKFYNFIATLPSEQDFESQIVNLRDNYNKQKESEFHDDKISFNHNISAMVNLIRQFKNDIEENKFLQKEKIDQLRERWFEIFRFISPILSFSVSFKEYLQPYPYFRLINNVEGESMSLRWMVGINEDIVYSINESFNDIDKLFDLERHILKIQNDLSTTSNLYGLIERRQSSLKEVVEAIAEQINNFAIKSTVLGINQNLDYKINVPKLYADILIVKEIITNLKNHSKNDEGTEIVVSLDKIDHLVKLKIVNEIAVSKVTKTSGEGLKCLSLLSECSLFGFKYFSVKEGYKYVQELTFKVY